MAKRKQYPLRIDKDVWEAIQKWAADDMRSANGQVEFILRRALRDAGRLPVSSRDKKGDDDASELANT
jgi:hypothetical protein